MMNRKVRNQLQKKQYVDRVTNAIIDIEDGGRAKVITIDGVEYILVTTYRGIGICKK